MAGESAFQIEGVVVEALPAPDPGLMFDTAYAAPPPSLAQERAELLELLRRSDA